MYQIPKQDVSAKYCTFIKPDQLENYENFIKKRNFYSMSIGLSIENTNEHLVTQFFTKFKNLLLI